MEVTYIYRNGQYMGRNVSFDNGGGVCLPAQTNAPQVSQNEHPEKPSTWGKISEFFQNLLFGSPIAGCAEDIGPTASQIQDGGISMVPPDAGDIDPENCYESGACRIDGGIILPTDDGDTPVLPDDIWFEIAGEGNFFQETPEILLESGYLTGHGLRNLPLTIELGTDSTKIEGMPVVDSGGDGIPENCFEGLININRLSEEDLNNGEQGCPEEGYEAFVVCPSDPNNRLKVYIGSYTIEAYHYLGGDFEKIGETNPPEVLSTAEELFTNPESGIIMPTIANPYTIPIPKEYHKSGELYLKLKLKLIVDARQADRNAHYQTNLRVRIIAE